MLDPAVHPPAHRAQLLGRTRRASIVTDPLEQKAQGTFVLVRLTVSNIGDQAQLFDQSSQKLVDNQGRQLSSGPTDAENVGAARLLPLRRGRGRPHELATADAIRVTASRSSPLGVANVSREKPGAPNSAPSASATRPTSSSCCAGSGPSARVSSQAR